MSACAKPPRLRRFCVERTRPSRVETFSNGYVKKCTQYCGEQFRKLSRFSDVVAIMKETELRAKVIRRKKGANATLPRNKRASAAEFRGMMVAFVEASEEHAARTSADDIFLPIREVPAPCKTCAQQRCRIQNLELRIKDMQSRNPIEMAAHKFVDEARGNVKDIDWLSARRKLLLLFHPDKLMVCPGAGNAFVKAFSTHRQWW